jgi:hypothetical protein
MAKDVTVRVVREGDTSRSNPFTICVIANPALEAPWKSGQYKAHPILGNRAAFDRSVAYIERVLFGKLPHQAERLLGEPEIEPRVRIVSLFAPGLTPHDANALVAEDPVSDLLIARRGAITSFLPRFGLAADIVYAVSKSASHLRASAWPASDDDTRGGVPFTVDHKTFAHRFWSAIPGTVAQHSTSTSLTALHEFGHALSSYSNGTIVDLYVDGTAGLNNRRRRPIPAQFAVYDGTSLAADPMRDGVGYPPGWQAYHCELNDPTRPAVMDDYWLADVPERCQHDRITRMFLMDRVRAKLGR